MAFEVSSTLTFDKNQVAVTLGRGLFGSHLGVAFHSANEGAKVLHLRFHKDLQIDSFPDTGYLWIGCIVDLPKIASATLIGILRGLAKKRPHIGYGLNFIAGQGAFSNSGIYKTPKGSDGYTCSTLITELFKQAGLPLIEEATWLPDVANLAWGNAVCCLIETLHPMEIDHLKAVKKNNIGLRVRPEEVAAAANLTYSARPVKFQEARAHTKSALDFLDETIPKIEPSQSVMHCVAIYEKQ